MNGNGIGVVWKATIRYMGKLSTAVAVLAGKSSKFSLQQEVTIGGKSEYQIDPDGAFVLINSVSGQAVRFNNLAQLNDFLASTGPGGHWPN